MMNAIWGITTAPFQREKLTLLSQQKTVFDRIKIHAQQGGFSVIIGEPGVGKTVLREHIEQLNNERECTVVSCSRTLHTYRQMSWQLAESFKLETTEKNSEKDLIDTAFAQVRERKTLYILIDEAHLLEWSTLRKLRLLFERFPKNHHWVLFGQPEWMYYLSLSTNKEINSRITYSASIKPLSDDDIERVIVKELEAAKMGINTFDEGALSLIIRSSEGNWRLCRNLCLASLIEAARETKKIVTITHVNNVLVQPHWRSHEERIKQQVAWRIKSIMMKKSLLTTHWSPEEADSILLFLDELRDVLLANYRGDIVDDYRQRQQQNQILFDFEDDAIPF